MAQDNITINKIETRIFAYPIEKGWMSKAELILEAEGLGLVWTVDGFLRDLNADKINDQDYFYGTYKTEITNEQL